MKVWKLCNYVSRDGLFNPDGRLINDVGNFQSLSDAVLYNAIAHALEGTPSSSYSKTAGASSPFMTLLLDRAAQARSISCISSINVDRLKIPILK